MPNKTIYVSQEDETLFEEARQIAGESLLSVIVIALREFVTQQKEKEKSMKEIAVQISPKENSREQRFVGMQVGKWEGVDDDRTWMLGAQVYLTQKKTGRFFSRKPVRSASSQTRSNGLRMANFLVILPDQSFMLRKQPQDLRGNLLPS